MEQKHKFYATILGAGVALFATVLATRGVHDSFIFHRAEADSNYHITLDSSNPYSSGATKDITTSTGNASVTFSYSSCQSASGYHAKINAGGSIKNDVQITSVQSLYPVFTASSGAILQFRASYDGNKWGEFAVLTSDHYFDLNSEPYFFEIKANGGSVNLKSLSFNYSCIPNSNAGGQSTPSTYFEKVVDAQDDYSGEYLIVYEHGSSPVAFDGSLTTLDANNDVFGVTINSKKIAYNATTHSKSFDFSAIENSESYSIKSRSGYYIGEKSGAMNTSSTTVYSNNITIYNDEDADIDGGNYYLRFNTSANRFRYYANNNMKNYITLYKANGGGSSIQIPEYEALLQITDNSADNYVYGHKFNESFGTENFSASILMSNGSEVALNPTDLTIDIEKNGTHYSTNDALNSEGTYNVTISYGSTLAPVTYQITVSKIAVVSVSFDKKTLRLKPAEDYTISATVLPETAFDKFLTWTSSDNSVATVSQLGKVVAASKEGTTTIEATANNGVFASCEVTVSNQTAHSGTSADDPFTVSEALAYYNDGGMTATGAVYITGVVTDSPSGPTVSSGRGRLYITDGNQTLYIYNVNGLTNTNNVTSSLIKVGNTLVVTGAIKDYLGTPQLAYINGQVNCYIISSTEQVIPVTGISVSPESTDVSVNNTVTLTATIAPGNASNKAVIWSSSNSNVASVDQNGVVTGLVAGQSATIYVKSAENNSISASCTVNVKAVAVQSVSLDKNTATIAIGEELTLTHTISPATATNQNVTWSSNAESVATVSNGVVSALAKGEATITVKTDDGNHTASCIVTVVDSGDLPQTTTVTIDCSSLENPSYSGNGITLSTAQSSGQSKPAVHSSGELRIYASNQMTISGGNITKIEITANNCTHTANNDFTGVSTGSYANWTWTGGPTDSVTFTAGGSGQIHITLIVITCGSGTPTPDPTLELIKVDSSAHRTFTVGDTFVKETIKAVYSDNNEVDVTNDATFTGYNMNTAGTQTIIVSYGGKSTTYQITVEAKVVTLTSITVSEDHRIFNVGDTFVKETVTAHYSDDSTKEVNATFSSSHNMSVAETYTIIVSYTENGITKDTSYTIQVKSSSGPVSGTIVIDKNLEGLSNAYDASNGSHDVTDDYSIVTSNICLQTDLQFRAKPAGYLYNTTASPVNTITISNDYNSLTVYAGNSEHPTANAITGTDGVYNLGGASYFTIVGAGTMVKVSSITVSLGTPTPVNPTGISITGENELTPGSSTQLSLSFSPINCNVKGVTWTSNNNSITVDSTGKVTVASTATVGATATITATSTEVGTVKGTFTITVVEQPVIPKDEWTVLIYMCGANLESEDGSATDDLSEIASVSGQPDDVNIVVQAGGAESWYSTYSSVVKAGKRNRFHLSNQRYISDSQTTKVNMGSSSSLQDFIEWGLSTYEAEKTALIFWNHGGAMEGACFDDEFNGDGLTPKEINTAINTARSNLQMTNKFEFIGYDCCLMQDQDIVSLHAPYSKYMIASQESEYGYGWSYNRWVDKLYDGSSTNDVLKACVDGFKVDTTNRYHSWGDTNDQTLSYINLTNWANYQTAFENFATYLNTNYNKNDITWANISSAINKAQKFGYCDTSDDDNWGEDFNDGYLYDVFDVGGAISGFKSSTKFKNNSSLMSYVTAWENAYSSLNIYEFHGSGSSGATGLSMFAPISGYNEKDIIYEEGSTNLTNWRNLCYNKAGNYWYK